MIIIALLGAPVTVAIIAPITALASLLQPLPRPLPRPLLLPLILAREPLPPTPRFVPGMILV